MPRLRRVRVGASPLSSDGVARLALRLRSGELSPREAVAATLARIEALDARVGAYLHVRGEEALAEAEALERAGGERGPLWGVPVAVKDMIDVAGSPTTASSSILRGAVATADAVVVARLRAAGAIVVGKTNTHEFAYGLTTRSPHFPPSRNPWDLERIVGGSSGGSGAAAAAGLAAGTLGTDTAGSIRIPCAFCGVSGVRPTTGLVPNRGMLPLSPSFDTIGPIAPAVEDCALLLQAIAGRDPQDASTGASTPPRYVDELRHGVAGLRIGVVAGLVERSHPRVVEAMQQALGELARLGAAVEFVEIPALEQAGTVQQAIQFPEATQVHLRWMREHLADYGADVRLRLLVGLFLPAHVYIHAQRARRLIYDTVAPLFERYDLLAAPSSPVVAPRIGDDGRLRLDAAELPAAEAEELADAPPALAEPLFRAALVRVTAPWSLLGLPVVCAPSGFVDGLPVGLALVGPRFGEAVALRAGHALQQATDWHIRRPELAAAGGAQ